MKPRSLAFYFITVALIVTPAFVSDSATATARADTPSTPGTPNAPSDPCGDPCFSNVTDILGGRRRLFPVDDLIVTNAYNNALINRFVVQTENGSPGGIKFDQSGASDETFATAVGRMLDRPNDSILTVTNERFTFYENGGAPTAFPLNVPGYVIQDAAVMADFTGDGFADFAYILNGNLYVATALDVTNLNAGLLFSAAGTPAYPVGDGSPASLAAGDLDGDGATELVLAHAWESGVAIDVFDVAVTRSQSQITGMELSVVGGTFMGTPVGVEQVKLTAGNYAGAINPATVLLDDDLVVAYKYRQNANNHRIDAASIQVTTSLTSPLALNLSIAGQMHVIDTEIDVTLAGMASDHLDFFDPTEQVVLGMQEQEGATYISVLTFDNSLNISEPTYLKLSDSKTLELRDIAVGNFDLPLSASQPLSLTIAALTLEHGQNVLLRLISVSPANGYALQEYAQANVFGVDLNDINTMSLDAGDIQGRSLFLGAPIRVTAQHIQPEIILGMPPMHVDWVSPDTVAPPTVFNVSAVPDSFFASYQTALTNTNQSSRQGTTSFSTSLTESIDQSVTMGVPDVASVTIDTKTSSTQMWANNVSKTHDGFTSAGLDASTQTGFDDHLWYVSERHNIYIYPVIGRVGCPEPTPNCTDAQKVPFNVMFSGPDFIAKTTISGANVEWYQPMHEPGNIFSYPGDLAQLQTLTPSLSLLSPDSPTTFYTDGSARTAQATWESGGSDSVTAGSTQNYAWSKSVSVSGNASVGILGGETSFSFSYDGSKSFSTLNSSTLSLGQSTGIGVQKPSTFQSPDQYQYGVQPFIFGENPVTGTLQSTSLTTTVQTNGILRAEYVVIPPDPNTDTNAGAWWPFAYDRPDVALNHPARWEVSAVTSGTTGLNCLAIGPGTSVADCATFNAPDSTTWKSEFHAMKGLFITPADVIGDSPQLTQATAGDQLRLQARIYNYSLADMPADSGVIVRFYGQPWNPNTLTPDGDAFLIDEVGLDPIPAFNADDAVGALPNWALAGTTKLNTAAHSDQFLAFWVVVWIQGPNQTLVTEMPDHGLKAIPGTLTSINAATPILQSHSNNIGFYKSLFFIAPLTAAAKDVPATAPGLGQVTLEQVTVEPQCAQVNEKVTVSAVLRAGDQALDGISTVFYDGDPDAVGKAFDVETISHVRANGTHKVMATFRPATPGSHMVHLATWPEKTIGRTKLVANVSAPPFGMCALYFPWMNFSSK